DDELSELINILASDIGSLTNPYKLSNTFKSVKKINISPVTLSKYVKYLEEAFIINEAKRYDVKGKKYIDTPFKYYFEDIGLRNARLDFRQVEENHIMENIIYNELRLRGYKVDVGVVSAKEKTQNTDYIKKQFEVDFVANQGNKRYYVQSAYQLNNDEKTEQEKRSLKKIEDSFKKIIVIKDNIKLRRDENGFVTIGIWDFLLNPNSLDL
ncbi:MAG: ATP-binding protein, partial [Verrucomicrobia bacterium]|nr:ATP-binding protein [Verrucomicrobiota bacterium]